MPKRSRSGLVSIPARVVAPASVKGGRSSLIERAAGPSPIMMSSWKSSSAGYRISSTTGARRWISSMNSTSRGSRLVRRAARSPGRSSTGPEVWRRLTPISRAMMCASVVLPRPDGPNSSTWSSASLRPRAAWMKISSWPRTLSWPTYSPSVAGRRERSNCSSCGETGRAEIMRSGSMLTAALILPEPLKPVFHPDREHLDLELLGVFPLPADRPVLRQAVVHPHAVVQLGLVALAGTGGRGQAPRLLLGAQHADLAEHREPRPELQAAEDRKAEAALVGGHVHRAHAGRHLSPVDIGAFEREIAVEAVTAEQLPAAVPVIAGRGAGIAPFGEPGLAYGAAQVGAALLGRDPRRNGKGQDDEDSPHGGLDLRASPGVRAVLRLVEPEEHAQAEQEEAVFAHPRAADVLIARELGANAQLADVIAQAETIDEPGARFAGIGPAGGLHEVRPHPVSAQLADERQPVCERDSPHRQQIEPLDRQLALHRQARVAGPGELCGAEVGISAFERPVFVELVAEEHPDTAVLVVANHDQVVAGLLVLHDPALRTDVQAVVLRRGRAGGRRSQETQKDNDLFAVCHRHPPLVVGPNGATLPLTLCGRFLSLRTVRT